MTKTGLGSLLVCALIAANGALAAPPKPLPAQTRVQLADLFGESDEEKAARLQKEQNQDDAINALNDKVRDLEDTIRNLTGQNETLTHRVQELNEKIDRQKKDFEYRLCAMTAQQLGAGTSQNDANAVPCPGEGGGPSSLNPPPPQTGGGPPQQLAPGPGILGTLPSGTPPQAVAPVAPSTQPEYSSAMNLLAKARYDEARAAFRSFADAHPKDDLAPQAIYWIGDIAYVQRDYPNATRAFAEVIKKYPTSSRAPDSMLKLGQALIASGQKKEGCTALAALPAKYPHATAAVLAQGSDARKAVCRGIS
ncbi:MAG TPA: tol-pal system protein YbgF [Rhizomicrobium sp.]|nr:tol-pal system protein YbgF [Rhizomicrobium sp.]